MEVKDYLIDESRPWAWLWNKAISVPADSDILVNAQAITVLLHFYLGLQGDVEFYRKRYFELKRLIEVQEPTSKGE